MIVSKISQYVAITDVEPDDLLVVVDVDDTSMAASGTTKRMELSQLPFDALNAASGAQSAAQSYALAQVTGEATRATTAEGVVSASVTAETTRAQNAEALLIQLAQRGAASGVATLDAGVHVPAAQLPAATTSALGAVILDGTAADQPWQFRPEAFGAKGNGKLVNDATMASGSPNLACATSTPFTSTAVDSGKHILVSTAAGAYAHVHLTISTVTDTGHAVLSGNATANTGGTPGSIAYFGTDDTAAIQSAINAAVAYAQAHNGYAEVLFGNKIYIIAGAFILGGATLGNFQIQLPIISPTSGQKIVIALKGPQESAPLAHWTQPIPQASGAVLASVRWGTGSTTADGSNNGTFGPSHIIGGPVSTYGGEPGLFSNCLVIVKGLATLSPYNAPYGGMDLFGMAQADVQSFAALTAAVVPSTSATVPTIGSYNNISNQWGWGLRMPCTGNNAVSHVGQFSTEGHCYGFGPSEHTVAEAIRCIYSITGIEAYSGNGVSMVHNAHIMSAVVEVCSNAVGVYPSGSTRLDIDNLEAESIGKMVNDPSNLLQGTIFLRPQGGAGSYGSSWVTSATGVRLINGMTNAGVIASPQAPPASAGTWANFYYRDLWIELALAGGTFTAFTVDGVTKPAAVGASGYAFFLPSGHSYVPTFTGTLTHVVTAG